MEMNRFFEKQYAFTFKECLKNFIGVSYEDFLDNSGFVDLLQDLGLISWISESGGYFKDWTSLSFFDRLEIAPASETIYEPYKILNKVISRFENHYLIVSNNENLEEDELIQSIKKVILVLDLTYKKYSSILFIYDTKKNALMSKVESGYTQSNSSQQNETHNNGVSNESENKFNDTPQAVEVGENPFADDKYVSELTKSKGETSDVGQSQINGQGSITHTNQDDKMTTIQRIAEIERNYQLTMLKWLNEFDKIFIEEGNL